MYSSIDFIVFQFVINKLLSIKLRILNRVKKPIYTHVYIHAAMYLEIDCN